MVTLTHWDIIELFQFAIIVGVSNASTDHGTMAVNVIVNAIHLVMATVDAGGIVVRDIAVDMLGVNGGPLKFR